MLTRDESRIQRTVARGKRWPGPRGFQSYHLISMRSDHIETILYCGTESEAVFPGYIESAV
jgi:hypothetical protein